MVKIGLIATHQITLDKEAVSLSQCAGILVLASALQEKSFDWKVIDLVEFYDISSSLDKIVDTIVTKIQDANIDVLCLSTMTYNLIIALEITGRLRDVNPSIINILGGPGVSFCAPEVLTVFPQIDAVIRGEAEIAFPKLIESLIVGSKIPKIAGLVYRDDGHIIDYGWPEPINNLNEVPFPIYDICFGEKVKQWFTKRKHGKGFPIILEIGRGCPFYCTFCCTSNYFKRSYRSKTVKRVMDEITVIQEKAEKKFISFNHDLLTLDHKYLNSLCKALVKLDPPIRWACFSRLDTLTPIILRKMRKAGCEGIYIGIDGATSRIQRIINKHLDLTNFKETLAILLDLGFHVTLSFIVGIPGETKLDLEELFQMLLYAKHQSIECVHLQIHTLAPELGTTIYETFKDSLSIDEYGSPGTAHIPIEWKKQFQTISSHPEIFSEYFYVPNPFVSRSDTLKLTFFGHIIDEHLRFSLQQAYSVLKDEVPLAITHNVTNFILPAHSSPEVDYLVLMNSIRNVILDLIGDNQTLRKKFESIIEYEIAVYKVTTRRSVCDYEIIKVSYDPKQLIECLLSKKSIKVNVDESNGFHLVFWDNSEEIAKSIPISNDLVTALQNRNITKNRFLDLLLKTLQMNVV